MLLFMLHVRAILRSRNSMASVRNNTVLFYISYVLIFKNTQKNKMIKLELAKLSLICFYPITLFKYLWRTFVIRVIYLIIVYMFSFYVQLIPLKCLEGDEVRVGRLMKKRFIDETTENNGKIHLTSGCQWLTNMKNRNIISCLPKLVKTK